MSAKHTDSNTFGLLIRMGIEDSGYKGGKVSLFCINHVTAAVKSVWFFFGSQREFVWRLKSQQSGEKEVIPMLASACPGENSTGLEKCHIRPGH